MKQCAKERIVPLDQRPAGAKQTASGHKTEARSNATRSPVEATHKLPSLRTLNFLRRSGADVSAYVERVPKKHGKEADLKQKGSRHPNGKLQAMPETQGVPSPFPSRAGGVRVQSPRAPAGGATTSRPIWRSRSHDIPLPGQNTSRDEVRRPGKRTNGPLSVPKTDSNNYPYLEELRGSRFLKAVKEDLAAGCLVLSLKHLSLAQERLLLEALEGSTLELSQNIKDFLLNRINFGKIHQLHGNVLVGGKGVMYFFNGLGQYVGRYVVNVACWFYFRVAGRSNYEYISMGLAQTSRCYIKDRFPTLEEFIKHDWAKGHSSLKLVNVYDPRTGRSTHGSRGYCWLPLYLASKTHLKDIPSCPLVSYGELTAKFGKVPTVQVGSLLHYSPRAPVVKRSPKAMVGASEIEEIEPEVTWEGIEAMPHLTPTPKGSSIFQSKIYDALKGLMVGTVGVMCSRFEAPQAEETAVVKSRFDACVGGLFDAVLPTVGSGARKVLHSAASSLSACNPNKTASEARGFQWKTATCLKTLNMPYPKSWLYERNRLLVLSDAAVEYCRENFRWWMIPAAAIPLLCVRRVRDKIFGLAESALTAIRTVKVERPTVLLGSAVSLSYGGFGLYSVALSAFEGTRPLSVGFALGSLASCGLGAVQGYLPRSPKVIVPLLVLSCHGGILSSTITLRNTTEEAPKRSELNNVRPYVGDLKINSDIATYMEAYKTALRKAREAAKTPTKLAATDAAGAFETATPEVEPASTSSTLNSIIPKPTNAVTTEGKGTVADTPPVYRSSSDKGPSIITIAEIKPEARVELDSIIPSVTDTTQGRAALAPGKNLSENMKPVAVEAEANAAGETVNTLHPAAVEEAQSSGTTKLAEEPVIFPKGVDGGELSLKEGAQVAGNRNGPIKAPVDVSAPFSSLPESSKVLEQSETKDVKRTQMSPTQPLIVQQELPT